MTMNPGVHLIAAVGLSGQIGLDGKVPWHGQPHFAENTERDLDQFARMTTGGILIMGSVTTQSLPKNFKPGSRTIFQWSRRNWSSPLAMLRTIRANNPHRDIWICGGQKVYELFIPYVDWHHISVIPYDGPADRFMPPILPTWARRREDEAPIKTVFRTERVPVVDEHGADREVDFPTRVEYETEPR